MTEPVADSPVPRRRSTTRRPPQSGLRVTCQRGPLARGPDLASSLLDLSETGAQLVVLSPLEPGEEVLVGLARPGAEAAAARAATVAWSLLTADGAYCVGVRFRRRMPLKDFEQLTLNPGRRGRQATPIRPALPLPAKRPAEAERRRAVRVVPNPLRRCRVKPSGGRPELEGTLLDVSKTGAGVAASGPLATGEDVIVRLGGAEALEVWGRVVYAVALKAGGVLAGVEFARPLSAERLRPFLARTNRPAGPQRNDS